MININYIKGLRAMNGDNQSVVAKALNLSLQSYNKKENGKVPYTVIELNLLSEYFEVPIANFFNQDVDIKSTN